MKLLRQILYTIALTVAIGTHASITEADSAYMNDDFLNAAAFYQQAIDSLGPSAERYYNLGNAYYRSGLIGMAIVNYERAHRINPSDKDIIENLEFVKSQTKDLIPESNSLFGGAADSISQNVHPNVWAWTAIICFILALCGVGTYFLSTNVVLRKVGFFGCGILIIACIIANIFAWRGTQKATATNEAIVISPSVILSTTPRQPKDRTEEALLLHEGAKVYILDSIATGKTDENLWYDVKIDNEHRAWIQASAIEII